jgi:hypothetical protein
MPIYVGDIKNVHAEFQDDNGVLRNCTVIEGGVSDAAILAVNTPPLDPATAANFVDLNVQMLAAGTAVLTVSATNSIGNVITGTLTIDVLPTGPTELPATKVVFSAIV